MNRTYDIIVFGASSFIGKTTARYLARTHGELRIALAGRSQAKLDALELGLDTIVADATSRDDMDRLARSAKVVVSTVGPYTRYGEGLVAACAEHGAHYADLTGEALFVRRSIDANHKAAQHSGARIVHSCGFDSVPSDMGMFFLAQQSPTPFEAVTMSVDRLKGGVSGGTIDSVRTMFAEAKRTPGGIELLDNPYSLCPQPEAEADIGKQSDSAAVFDATLG